MSKIKVMSRELSNRIAAGEVIERPASVVKELAENALDAGAGNIVITVEHAGTKLISVRDDGCGMSPEDVQLAMTPHGTSKLTDFPDLENIMTLGFRGEALPSIASVSRFSLRSRERGQSEGVRIECDPDGGIKTLPDGGPVGTTAEVRDLFFNIPARRKFLRSAATEEHHIEEMVMILALGHYEVGFELKLDNRRVFQLSAAGDVRPRLMELFGRNYVNNMLKVDHKENDLHIHGYIGSPGFTRPSRREQRVFINRRAVEAQAVYRGIKEGYGALSASDGRFPPAVLYIDMDPKELDVNVHPAKREVRFRAESIVSRAVAQAIARAVRGDEYLQKEEEKLQTLPLSGKVPLSGIVDAAMVRYQLNAGETAALPGTETPQEKIIPAPPAAAAEKKLPEEPIPGYPFDDEPKDEIAAHYARLRDKIRSRPEPPSIELSMYDIRRFRHENAAFTGSWPEKIIGVLDNTYILCCNQEGLVLIDQHAAHERVIFEEMMRTAAKGESPSQRLLMPKTLELSRSQMDFLMRYRELFIRMGFDVESAGGNTVIVSGVPIQLAESIPAEDLILNMLNELLETDSLYDSYLPPDNIARAACKAAVKAHDRMEISEIEELLRRMKKCCQGTLCPHGRPTMISITTRELEKRFLRR